MTTLPSSRPPPVDRLLATPALAALIEVHGRADVLRTVRDVLASARSADSAPFDPARFEQDCREHLQARAQPRLRRVLNLTGTVLHTNLGRAVMPPEAIEAVARVMAAPVNLEYTLETGDRGDRDDHVEALLCELTGAAAATVVNNNAAAVLLVLNTLALGKEVPVSRGELVEIGGAFRIPDVMRRAGSTLVEVGTTNRTHAQDFEQALGPQTGLVMKVHTSNYAIQGFTSAVGEAELAQLCRRHDVPFAVDLGSGTLVDLTRWGLPAEPTPRESISAGAQLVTFSGDKLLGGPQAGLIVGDAALIARIKRNPLKRALRCDKMTLAALEAVLALYRDPDRLAQRLPTLRALTRPVAEIRGLAERVAQAIAPGFAGRLHVSVRPCRSQIGSGSLPIDRLDSASVALGPPPGRAVSGSFPEGLAAACRALPVPVIGRIEAGELRLDMRCLEDESLLVEQLRQLPF